MIASIPKVGVAAYSKNQCPHITLCHNVPAKESNTVLETLQRQDKTLLENPQSILEREILFEGKKCKVWILHCHGQLKGTLKYYLMN